MHHLKILRPQTLGPALDMCISYFNPVTPILCLSTFILAGSVEFPLSSIPGSPAKEEELFKTIIQAFFGVRAHQKRHLTWSFFPFHK